MLHGNAHSVLISYSIPILCDANLFFPPTVHYFSAHLAPYLHALTKQTLQTAPKGRRAAREMCGTWNYTGPVMKPWEFRSAQVLVTSMRAYFGPPPSSVLGSRECTVFKSSPLLQTIYSVCFPSAWDSDSFFLQHVRPGTPTEHIEY